MIQIDSIWKQYFKNHHEGLGTTYERFILHNYFKNIKNKYSVQSVLEVPSFGMTGISGINSMWWALNGNQTVIVDHRKERIDLIKKVWKELSVSANFIYNTNDYQRLPFDDNSFNMGWNFAALWFVPRLEEFLSELTRVTNSVIFICVPNSLNVFYRLRAVAQKNSNYLFKKNIDLDKIKKIMSNLKWQVAEQGFLDVPPWPDIAMNKEDLLEKIGLNRISKNMKKEDENKICILDYFSGKNRDMEKEILKYGFLEDMPAIIKAFWAHHQYLIFTPG